MTAAMYAPVKEAAWAALTDDNAQVALTAAEFFLAHAANEPGPVLLEKASRLPQWRVRATLLAAALRQTGPEPGCHPAARCRSATRPPLTCMRKAIC